MGGVAGGMGGEAQKEKCQEAEWGRGRGRSGSDLFLGFSAIALEGGDKVFKYFSLHRHRRSVTPNGHRGYVTELTEDVVMLSWRMLNDGGCYTDHTGAAQKGGPHS